MSLGRVGEEFDPHIFRCRDGSYTPERAQYYLRVLHDALLSLRKFIRDPKGGDLPLAEIEILSGYRSADYNKKVGGSTRSEHMQGSAADIAVMSAGNAVLPGKVQAWVDLLQRDGRMPKGGLGRYPGFTHVDVRGVNARWAGKRKDGAK